MNSTLSMAVTVALALLAACSGETANRSVTRTPESLVVPELRPRVEGLRGAEYDRIVASAATLCARLGVDPRDVDALGRLAALFMNEARITGDHPYYYPAAMSLVDRALAIAPDDFVALVSKGSILLSLHRFDEALDAGERAARRYPASAIVQGILVDANAELGRYDAAVAAADRMVAFRPDLRSYSRVSYMRELHGDIDGAIAAMMLAVSAGAPGSEEKAWARTTLGELLASRGRHAEARRELELAAIERDRYPFALAGLARIAHVDGDDRTALALLDSALSMVPEFSFASLKADILRERGETAAADSLVRAIEAMLAEDEAAGHQMNIELAILRARNGVRLTEAIGRAKRELDRRPNSVTAQHTMAYVLLRAGRPAEAKPLIDRALRLGGGRPEWRAHAGLIEAALKNRQSASKLLRDASRNRGALDRSLRAEVDSALRSL